MSETVRFQHYEVFCRDDGSSFEPGRGTTGVAFKARDLETGRTVALLVLDPSLSEACARLEKEVAALQTIKHPAVIGVYGLEHAEETVFVTKEWVEGPSLLDAMNKPGELSTEEIIEILTSLAGGLEAVQKTGIPCPGLPAHDITLVKKGAVTLPKFNALNFTAMAPARSVRGGTDYGVAIAALAFRMLGGTSSDPRELFVPIPGISEEANLVLRSALKSGDGVASPVAFVAALEDAMGQAAPAQRPRATPSRSPVAALIVSGLVVLAGIAIAIFATNSSLKKSATEPDPASMRRVEDLAASENYVAALTLLEELLAKYPNSAAQLEDVMDSVMAKLGSETDDFLTPDQLAKLTRFLEKASRRGSTAAQMLLAKSYLPNDPARAFQYFHLAATDGRNSEAMYQLGDMYESGRGVDGRDDSRAVEWFQKAGFHPQAIYALGECYYYGNGVPQDYRRAWELLNTAANEYGNRNAQVLLGDLYHDGRLGGPNYAEAARLWQAAAAQGLQDARTKLILMIFTGEMVDGHVVKKNPAPSDAGKKLAAEQFKREANTGNRSSMYYYAQCLLGLVPGLENPGKGREQMEKAASMGDVQAQQFCDRNGWKYAPAPR
jgi:TPR repeat protein